MLVQPPHLWVSSELLGYLRTKIGYLKVDDTLGVQKVREKLHHSVGMV